MADTGPQGTKRSKLVNLSKLQKAVVKSLKEKCKQDIEETNIRFEEAKDIRKDVIRFKRVVNEMADQLTLSIDKRCQVQLFHNIVTVSFSLCHGMN